MPIVVVIIGTFVIVSAFFNVYTMAVDTLLLCVLEDLERNNGSKERPYFMSKGLMKVLGIINEESRSRYSCCNLDMPIYVAITSFFVKTLLL